jgi:hypothetical protein
MPNTVMGLLASKPGCPPAQTFPEFLRNRTMGTYFVCRTR